MCQQDIVKTLYEAPLAASNPFSYPCSYTWVQILLGTYSGDLYTEETNIFSVAEDFHIYLFAEVFHIYYRS